MSIDIVTKNGKKLGKITDSSDEEDTIMIKGKEMKLSDAYLDEQIRNKFNSQISKEIKDDKSK